MTENELLEIEYEYAGTLKAYEYQKKKLYEIQTKLMELKKQINKIKHANTRNTSSKLSR